MSFHGDINECGEPKDKEMDIDPEEMNDIRKNRKSYKMMTKNTFLVDSQFYDFSEVPQMIKEIEDGVYSKKLPDFSTSVTNRSLDKKIMPRTTKIQKVPTPNIEEISKM